ncbi:MAG: hypothetical protein U0003_03300 [Vampirovibrionales bacterium]
MTVSRVRSSSSNAFASVGFVVPAPPLPSGKGFLSQRLHQALQATRQGALRWTHNRRRRPGVFSTAWQIEDTWLAVETTGTEAITYTLTAHFPESREEQSPPTALHRWSISIQGADQPKPEVLDGQLLALSQADSPIAALFEAVYQTLTQHPSQASLPVGFTQEESTQWLPTIEALYQQVHSGVAPVTLSIIPPSAANPLASVATVVQIGQTITEQTPRLEIIRAGETTQLTLRTLYGVQKQRWNNDVPVVAAVDRLVALAQAQVRSSAQTQ